jgi:hypothetical protein
MYIDYSNWRAGELVFVPENPLWREEFYLDHGLDDIHFVRANVLGAPLILSTDEDDQVIDFDQEEGVLRNTDSFSYNYADEPETEDDEDPPNIYDYTNNLYFVRIEGVVVGPMGLIDATRHLTVDAPKAPPATVPAPAVDEPMQLVEIDVSSFRS